MLCLGLIQGLFEGAMYVFVLQWTPALTHAAHGRLIPYGLVFSTFMMAVFSGSSLVGLVRSSRRRLFLLR